MDATYETTDDLRVRAGQVESASVVVVDDDLLARELMAEFLSEMGELRLELFESAAAALKWCAEHEPDLVITNYEMPGLDGVSFVQELRGMPHFAGVPVIVVTAAQDPSVRFLALEAGANDYLSKPLAAREVQARTKNMLAVRTGYRAMHQRSEWLAEEVEFATKALEDREQETILSLSRALGHRESEAGQHSLRMAHYCKIIGQAIGLHALQLRTLFLAAPLHDIGKIGVPDHILMKPARLSDSEFQVMKLHTTIGHEILADCRTPLLRAAADIALNHHERWDGTGYPSGLAGEEIPIPSRIVAAADVLDALLSSRPYKHGWEWEAAIGHVVQGEGAQFAPEVSKACSKASGELRDVFETLQD